MATPIPEGIYGCTATSADFGTNDKGEARAQITVVINEGPGAGRRVTYEEPVNAKSAKYVAWACSAVGWKGGPMTTLKSDVADWIANTGGATTVEIKHIVVRRGTPEESIWDKPSSIGKGAAKALKPATGSTLADADAAMRSVMGTPHEDVPPPHEDDIPFATINRDDLGAIAKVLR